MGTVEIVAGLIEKSYGHDAAAVYRAFRPSNADLTILAEIGVQLLEIFPPTPGACVVMSALYASQLQAVGKAPVHVAVGALSIGNVRIFGNDELLDGESRFSRSDLSWDGHAWVVFGNYLADVSLCRTAYSKQRPPLLASHVLREFGPRRGLFISNADDAIKSGLDYFAQYILSEHQITGLARGAMQIIDSASIT